MNNDDLVCLGEHLRERAQREVSLLTFMLKHADPEVWAKADQAGLKPESGNWVGAMNRYRTKRAATKAEAEEIVRLVQVRYGDDSESILEWLRHAVFDPLWALRNLRVMAGETGLTATTSDGVEEV